MSWLFTNRWRLQTHNKLAVKTWTSLHVWPLTFNPVWSDALKGFWRYQGHEAKCQYHDLWPLHMFTGASSGLVSHSLRPWIFVGDVLWRRHVKDLYKVCFDLFIWNVNEFYTFYFVYYENIVALFCKSRMFSLIISLPPLFVSFRTSGSYTDVTEEDWWSQQA